MHCPWLQDWFLFSELCLALFLVISRVNFGSDDRVISYICDTEAVKVSPKIHDCLGRGDKQTIKP